MKHPLVGSIALLLSPLLWLHPTLGRAQTFVPSADAVEFFYPSNASNAGSFAIAAGGNNFNGYVFEFQNPAGGTLTGNNYGGFLSYSEVVNGNLTGQQIPLNAFNPHPGQYENSDTVLLGVAKGLNGVDSFHQAQLISYGNTFSGTYTVTLSGVTVHDTIVTNGLNPFDNSDINTNITLALSGTYTSTVQTLFHNSQLLLTGSGTFTTGSLSVSGQVTVNGGTLHGDVVVLDNAIPDSFLNNRGANSDLTPIENSSLTITGSNAKLEAPSFIEVGVTTGKLVNLNVNNGATANVGQVFLAVNAGAKGNLTIDGGTFTSTDFVDIGFGESSVANVNVKNSGKLTTTNAAIGFGTDSQANVTIDGAGSQWTIKGFGVVGYNSGDTTNTLTVKNGGKVTSEQYLGIGGNSGGTTGSGQLVIASGGEVVSGTGLSPSTLAGAVGFGPNSTGIVTIDGSDSSWEVMGRLNIGFGQGSTGTVKVTNGGTLLVDGDILRLGNAAGSTGTLIFDEMGGSPVFFTFNGDNTDGLIIGDSGNGHFDVLGGAQITSSSLVQIARGKDSVSDATVLGAGSIWNVEGDIAVGENGMGTLTIKGGATVRTEGGSVTLGEEENGVGTLIVDGVGSTLDLTGASTAGTMQIGGDGRGILEVKNGASVTLVSTVLGDGTTNVGEILLDGKSGGTPSTVTINGTLTVGGSSSGQGGTLANQLGLSGGIVSITGGASLTVTTGDVIIGRDASASGEITLSGQGSNFTTTGTGKLIVGQKGAGELTVSDQAQLLVSNLIVGQNAATGENANFVTLTGTPGGSKTKLTVTQSLIIGDGGTGELDATGGAMLSTAQTVKLGSQVNAVGTVDLSGQGTTWDATGGRILIGDAGRGKVTVQGGAVIQNALAITLANDASTGELDITGSGSKVTATMVQVGGASNAVQSTITIGAGGALQTGNLELDGGTPFVSVDGKIDGVASRLTTDSLTLTPSTVTNGGISVTNSGNFTVTGGTINLLAKTQFKLFVVGDNSIFSAQNSAFNVSAGSNTSLIVNVISGGTLTTGAATMDGSGSNVTVGASGDTSTSTWTATGSGGGNALTISNGGRLEIFNGGNVTLTGAFLINSTASVRSLPDAGAGGPAKLSASGIEVNGGFVTISGNSQFVSNGTTFLGDSIDVHANGTIDVFHPGADLSGASMALTSGGQVAVQDSGHVGIRGQITVGTGSTLDTSGGGRVDIGTVLGGAADNSIAIGFGGVLKNSGNVFATTINLSLGGVAGGRGTYNGAVINGGKVAPGDPQTMTVNGNYTQLPTGTLDLQIAGTGVGNADKLVVTGTATLDGFLELDFINGFAPHVGDTFDLLSSGSTIGQFSNVEITGLRGGWTFTLNPSGTSLELISTSNAVFQPEFLVPFGPNTILTGVTSDQTIHFLGGVLEATSNATLPNAIILGLNGGTFQADAGTSSTLGGVIAGPGIFTKTGPGALTLLANSTYTGDTFINEGSLFVQGSLASPDVFVGIGGLLGGHGTIFGNLFNAGTVSPGNSPGTLHVSGNYTQAVTGLLRIEIAGRDAASHDLLAIGATAHLDGTLQLVRLDRFKLKRNEPVTFLTAAGGVSGKFSTVLSDFTSDTILEPTVVYHANSVALVAVQGSFGNFADGWSLSPNQKAVARGLDSLPINRRNNSLFDYLDYRQLSKLPGDLDKIAPEELTSMFTIATSLAQVQSQNIQRRTDDIRSGTSGFSASGLAVNGAGPSYSGSFGRTDGVAGPTGKDGKDAMVVADYHEDPKLGVFLSGTGEWVSVGDTENARGYDLTSGGFTLGVDYKVTPNFAFGVMAGYTGSSADLANRGRVYVNGGKIGLYATLFQNVPEASAPTMSKDTSKDTSKETPASTVSIAKGFYADLAVNGGYNSYDTRRSALQGEARGDTDGGELNALMGTGYDFKKGGLTFGPTATFNYTYLGTGNFTEHGSLAPLDIHGGKGESLRTAFGFKASYDWKVGGVLLKPEIRAAWQHEYGDAVYSLNSSFANGGGDSFAVSGPKIGRDSALLGAGFAVEFNDRCSAYLYYDGDLGRQNYQSTSVTGGLRIAF